MKLIIGLGNPGNQYEKTRHNIGFKSIDLLFKDLKIDIIKKKFNSLYTKSGNVIIMKPQTFMNLSGDAVAAMMQFFKISIKDILVIYDDMSYEVGQFVIKIKGSSGGQKGIKDIIKKIGTSNFARLKIGIGRGEVAADHVLSNFSKMEAHKMEDVLKEVILAIKEFMNSDIELVMNKFNKRKSI